MRGLWPSFDKRGAIAAHGASGIQNNARDIRNSRLPQRRNPKSIYLRIFRRLTGLTFLSAIHDLQGTARFFIFYADLARMLHTC
jgi:hypothetical protein